MSAIAGACAIIAVIAFYHLTDDTAVSSAPSGFVAPTHAAPVSAPAYRAPASGRVQTFRNGSRWHCDELIYEFDAMNDVLNDAPFVHQHVANLITLDAGMPLVLPRDVRRALAECGR